MNLTLLEVHLDDASFTANAPLSGESEAASTADEAHEGGRSLLPFLAGLVGLAVVAYVVRRWRSDGTSPSEIEAEAPDLDAPTP